MPSREPDRQGGVLKPSLYELDARVGRAEVLSKLADLPARLRDALGAVGWDGLLAAPARGEWSAFQTLCHLRDAAIVYSARFRWIVLDDNPLLPNYDEDNWVAAAPDRIDDLPDILDEFAATRAGLIRLLTRLPDEAWQRTGRHEVLGEVKLEPYVRHQLRHEQMHLDQLRAALARR
jgi:hypothetical protein